MYFQKYLKCWGTDGGYNIETKRADNMRKRAEEEKEEEKQKKKKSAEKSEEKSR